MRRVRVAVVVVVIVLVGIIGYAGVGFAYASNRVAIADRSLNTVISHQNNLNSTFKDIDTQFNGLSSNSTFNPKESRTVIDKFVTNAKAAVTMVDKDDASLTSARRSPRSSGSPPSAGAAWTRRGRGSTTRARR